MARMKTKGDRANVELTVAELERRVGRDIKIRVSVVSLQEAVTKLAKDRLAKGLS